MTQAASEHLGESLGTDFFSVREQFTDEQWSHYITVWRFRMQSLIASRARGNPVRSGSLISIFPERTGVLLPRQLFPGSWVARRRRREASTSASAAARSAQDAPSTLLPGSSSL
jgi:hypothetical protein